MTTARNRREPSYNRRLGFEAAPYLIFGGWNILMSGNIQGTRKIQLPYPDLIIFFASSDLINSINSSNIIFGISSDHSIVAAKISKNVSAWVEVIGN